LNDYDSAFVYLTKIKKRKAERNNATFLFKT
jgi:hypothetical protein